MEGLGNLFESLYNVNLNHEETDHGEVWSHDVLKLVSRLFSLVDSVSLVGGYFFRTHLVDSGLIFRYHF